MTPKIEEKPVRVRFAPSPTGPLHIGGVRTALFNWLFARQNKGVFVLRIEDTDAARSEKKYEAEIMEGLKWVGLDWDEGPLRYADERGSETQINADVLRADKHRSGTQINADTISDNLRNNLRKSAYGPYGPYRQSERTTSYKKYLEKLLAEGKAYYCYCTKEELEAERQAMLAQGLPPKYSGHCRQYAELRGTISPPPEKSPQVIRFKTSEAQVKFKDIIRGDVNFDAGLFGDMIIAKDLETPLYNFAAMVDDEEMEISHVIRGEEHLSNTPKQILMQKALGFREPEYAHLPLILNPDRSKMSKRFADTALSSYREQGYLPEALINFLVLLGWHPKDNRELFALPDLVNEFDLKRVQKAGAVFNQEKLDWLQKEYIKNLSVDEIVGRLKPALEKKGVVVADEFLKKVVEAERPRLKTLDEFFDLAGFFFKLPDYEASLLIWQKEPAEKIKNTLGDVLVIIKNLGANLDRKKLLDALAGLTEKEGRGAVLWPLRAALSGQIASPDPTELAEILGREETMRRIKIAIEKLEKIGDRI